MQAPIRDIPSYSYRCNGCNCFHVEHCIVGGSIIPREIPNSKIRQTEQVSMSKLPGNEKVAGCHYSLRKRTCQWSGWGCWVHSGKQRHQNSAICKWSWSQGTQRAPVERWSLEGKPAAACIGTWSGCKPDRKEDTSATGGVQLHCQGNPL